MGNDYILVKREYRDEYAEAEAVTGAGVYVITETPQTVKKACYQPSWVGYAANAADALERYMDVEGFAHYSETEMRKQVIVWGNDEGFILGAGAPFTNTFIYSMLVPTGEVDEE